MRCYFMRDGHIEAVEELRGLRDEGAIAKAPVLFSERKQHFEGFELRDRARVLIRHSEPPPQTSRSLAASQGPETRCRLGSSRG
jgi:hypothetical protein